MTGDTPSEPGDVASCITSVDGVAGLSNGSASWLQLLTSQREAPPGQILEVVCALAKLERAKAARNGRVDRIFTRPMVVGVLRMLLYLSR
jgi:hypothetical protein